MIRAACHCTRVRLEIEAAPTSVLDCNCTLCRRYGALWAYYEPDKVVLVQGDATTDTYGWDSGHLAFHRCTSCGCITHITSVDRPTFIHTVNVRMMLDVDPSAVRIQQKNNGQTGFFWSRADAPIVASQHPKIPHDPDGWR